MPYIKVGIDSLAHQSLCLGKDDMPTMKNKVLLLSLLLVSGFKVFSQNKTLAIGTNTPNSNAALHVDAPNGNQGALMPRLTTAQRNAMTPILGTADAGLLLYDNDLKTLYIWNGTAWESSAKIHYPLVDTLSTLPANGNALRLVYNGTDVGNFGVAHFENLNPNAGFSAIFGRTNSATNGAADLVVNNPANTNDALSATTNALNGRAGSFLLNNTSSRNYSLYAQSNGDSTGAAVHGNNIGNGFGVYGKSAGSKFASVAVYGEHVGTGDAAGAFRISNAANTYSALYGETNGSGPALFANAIGSGRGGQIQINNPANSSAALRAFTNGTGNAGFFTVSNVSNTQEALRAQTDGSGAAISANNNGTGFGIYATAVGPTDAIYAEKKATDANGSAGNFWNKNSTNGASALFASTNAAAGTALGLINSADGNALAIFQGGVQVSSVSVSSAGAITAKAGLYEISVVGTFTLPAAGAVGETCLVSNTSGSAITVSGSSVATATVRQFIRLTGGWQIVN